MATGRTVKLLSHAGPLLLALGGRPDENLSIFDPVSPPAASIRDLFFLVMAITGAIFLLVEGFLFYCMFYHRDRGDHRTVEPPQIYGSKPVEVAWTVAPLLIVFVLFLVVARTIADVKVSTRPKDAMHVVVVGHQWWWEYRYPKQDVLVKDENGVVIKTIPIKEEIVTANELHVPAGVAVWFDLQSADVIHSFWFPRLNGKTDVVPGRDNHTWFQVMKAGTYLGQCAEYCGNQHANMILRLEADPPEQFQTWSENQQRPTNFRQWLAEYRKEEESKLFAKNAPLSDRGWHEITKNIDHVRDGYQVFHTNACANCHTIRGTPAKGTFGPDLTHLWSRETLGSAMVRMRDERGNPVLDSSGKSILLQWIDDPDKIKPACWMPAMKLNETEQEQVVSYLQTLK